MNAGRFIRYALPGVFLGGAIAWAWINRYFVIMEDTTDMSASNGTGKLYPGESPYSVDIQRAEESNGIPRRLLASLLYQESRYRPDIINGDTRSSVGAMGIAQFMPDTAREWLGMPETALDPYKAIPGAARYLRWIKGYVGGDWRDAVMAYNWGPGNVKRWIANGRPALKVPLETRKYAISVYDSVFA